MAKGFNDDKSKIEVAEQSVVNGLLTGQLKVKVIQNSNMSVAYNNAVVKNNRVPSGTVAAIPVITGSDTAFFGISTACSIGHAYDTSNNTNYWYTKSWIANNSNYTWRGTLTTYVFYTGEDDS